MKRLFLFTLFLTTTLSNCLAQLVNEDFESYSTGTVITTTPSTLNNYQIDQNVGCTSDEQWIIKDVFSFSAVTCNFCSNNAATIYYGFCDQNSTLVPNPFNQLLDQSIFLSIMDFNITAQVETTHLLLSYLMKI